MHFLRKSSKGVAPFRGHVNRHFPGIEKSISLQNHSVQTRKKLTHSFCLPACVWSDKFTFLLVQRSLNYQVLRGIVW